MDNKKDRKPSKIDKKTTTGTTSLKTEAQKNTTEKPDTSKKVGVPSTPSNSQKTIPSKSSITSGNTTKGETTKPTTKPTTSSPTTKTVQSSSSRNLASTARKSGN